eukprot:GHVU01003653.1.p1 GENE.GHVU01003653.1~~GHVU01003653.1.p1  ORF type:complete len:717 (+),score=84.69 GHVU01003653.1:50-2152(+)
MDSHKKCKSIFPELTSNIGFELWLCEVDAIKATSSIWLELEDERRHSFEAHQLILACHKHSQVSAGLLAVYRKKTAGEFSGSDERWLGKSWETIKAICGPLDKDMRNRLKIQLETLPQRAVSEFGGNVHELLIHFNELRSDTVKYGALYTEEMLADLLIRSSPARIQDLLRLTMKEDQKDPNRVVEELRTLANATGATLGTGSKLSVREEDGTALFTGRLNRPGRVEGKESLEEKRGFPKRRPQRQFEEGGCGRCGFEQHNNADDCPARGVICRRCGKKGHYARQCKTKSETKHQPGNGPQVESIRFVEINDEEEGWMVCKGKEKERVLYADTCCSASLVPRSLVEGCIVKERPKSSRYTLAQFDKGLVVETEAIVMIGVEDDKGEYQKIGLKVNIGPENIHGLIKPRRAYLGYDNEVSWITVLDSDKRERKIKVVHAGAEKARRNLPFFKFIPVPQIPVETCNGHVAWNVRENVSIQEWHERWFHPGTARMIGSLKEAHIPFNPAEVRALAESCTKCKQKNATFHKIPRSYGRRVGERKSTFNYRVSWDLGHISERGYKGEHYFSLLIDDSSLWWEAMPLKEKGEAPDHLLEWISKNEAMNRLRSDNAGELKGSRVTIMCKDNNIYMEGIPPYCSQVNGVVERAIREVRSLLRIVLDMLNLPPSMWSALVRGIVELHNNHQELIRGGRNPRLGVEITRV